MLFLYNALCTLLWPVLWLYTPFRGSLRARLGRGLRAALAAAGYERESSAPRILVNAVSAGEVVAISSFIAELKRRLPEAQIVLLTTTDSGQEMARQKLSGLLSLCWYFPLADLHFVVGRYLKLLNPQIYVSTESELWPNIQAQCRRRGIPAVLVNARLYLHNKTGLRGNLVRRLYSMLDLIVCQSERQRANFVTFGFGSGRPALAVSGNTKFDFAIADWDEAQWAARRLSLALGGNDTVVVAGSTHSGEETALLDAFLRLRAEPEFECLHLIIAARHIERNVEIASLATKAGFRCLSLSQIETNSGQAWDVLLVDRYGMLVDLYRLADAVVMGGTFAPKVGGHNLLEATALGKPVVCGPSIFGITAQVELLREADALVELADEGSLSSALRELLTDTARATLLGQRARAVTLANRGAASRAVDAVLGLLPPADGPGRA